MFLVLRSFPISLPAWTKVAPFSIHRETTQYIADLGCKVSLSVPLSLYFPLIAVVRFA